MRVTIRSKFQVTIPAKLREEMNIREGDVLDATVVENGILLQPQKIIDRKAVADRVAKILARIKPSPEDAGRSEEEIMQDIIDDIAEARKERREAGA